MSTALDYYLIILHLYLIGSTKVREPGRFRRALLHFYAYCVSAKTLIICALLCAFKEAVEKQSFKTWWNHFLGRHDVFETFSHQHVNLILKTIIPYIQDFQNRFSVQVFFCPLVT